MFSGDHQSFVDAMVACAPIVSLCDLRALNTTYMARCDRRMHPTDIRRLCRCMRLWKERKSTRRPRRVHSWRRGFRDPNARVIF